VSAVLSGGEDRTIALEQRTLQPRQAVVVLADEDNVKVDVAAKTPLSDWL
jgi:hypothetical protein